MINDKKGGEEGKENTKHFYTFKVELGECSVFLQGSSEGDPSFGDDFVACIFLREMKLEMRSNKMFI